MIEENHPHAVAQAVPDTACPVSPCRKRPRIAVVAVHGVGTHEPRESAVAVAKMLASQRQPGSAARYAPFREQAITIVTRPVQVGQAKDDCEQRLDYQHMTAQLTEDDQLKKPKKEKEKEKEGVHETVCFESGRLEDDATGSQVKADVHVFEAYWDDLSRLSSNAGRVLGEFFQLLFEVAWLGVTTIEQTCSDFTEPEQKGHQLCGETVQRVGAWWRRVALSQKIAAGTLTLPIPVLNLLLLGVLSCLVPGLLKPEWQEPVSLAILAIAGVVVAQRIVFNYCRLAFSLWVVSPLIGGGLATGIGYWLFSGPPANWEWLLTLEWAALAATALYWLMTQYEKRRPGAVRTFAYCVVPVVLILLGSVFSIPWNLLGAPPITRNGIAWAVVRTVDVIYLALVICWFLVVVAGWVSCTVAGIALNITKKCRSFPPGASPDEKLEWDTVLQRARRAIFTARLSLMVPISLGLIVTLALYDTLRRAAEIGDVAKTLVPPIRYEPVSLVLLPGNNAEHPGSALKFLEGLIIQSGTSAFAALIFLVSLAAAFLIWGLLPVALAEGNSPNTAQSTDEESERYGKWLNNGYRQMRLAGELIFVGVSFVLTAAACAEQLPVSNRQLAMGIITGVLLVLALLFIWPGVRDELGIWDEKCRKQDSPSNKIVQVLSRIAWFLTFAAVAVAGVIVYPRLEEMNRLGEMSLIASLSSLIVGSAVGMRAVGGAVSERFLALRPALDAALDVENHLRLLPHGANPRAEISTRFASLLRYLCQAERPDDPQPWGYDAIVIVAHSQGTVITADLLRFLHCQKELESSLQKLRAATERPGPRTEPTSGIPIYLFTMGCPLRQLYGLRFPHLYGWARHHDYDTRLNDPIPHDQQPCPSELAGVVAWTNAYRSGDYVGRHLWRSDREDTWQVRQDRNDQNSRPLISFDEKGTRREFCIGLGAHTHYWDDTAPSIAECLDELVREAVARGR